MVARNATRAGKPVVHVQSAPSVRRFVRLLAAVAVLLGARQARAGDVEVRGLDGTPWERLVQKIQDGVASQSGVFPVLVSDGHNPIPCSDYQLRLDSAAAAAFEVEACDPRTDATSLRLVRPEALFEPGNVPRARKVAIDATTTPRAPNEIKPPRWWVAVDWIPLMPTATAVGTVLVRPMGDLVLPSGWRASTLYGGRPAVFGGSTFGVTVQHGALFFPVRFTVAGDRHALVLSGFAGLGWGWSVLHHTSLYAAPALRYTGMDFRAGWFHQVDGALLVGVRRRLWRDCAKPQDGWEAFFETATPIGSSGPAFFSGGISMSWGPEGSWPGPTRCKRS